MDCHDLALLSLAMTIEARNRIATLVLTHDGVADFEFDLESRAADSEVVSEFKRLDSKTK